MVLQTTAPKSYTRIKAKRHVNQFISQQQMNWRKYPCSLLDRDYLSIKNVDRLLIISKYPDYIYLGDNNLRIQNKYDFIQHIYTRAKSPNIRSSFPSIVKKRINELKQLASGWDSYAARPINTGAIDTSISLLANISSNFGQQLVQDVFIAPCSDGGIQLEWELNLKELIIKISPDGKQLDFLFVSSSGEEKEGAITSKVELANLLQEFSSP